MDMRSYQHFFVFFLLAGLLTTTAVADGVMRPTNKSYPKDFLRHRMSKVDVAISGQIAQTTVYQEFVNEWDSPTDAVFSFPLPPDARATNFYFWVGDTMYKAVLKVKEQAPNPGTGEGGIDALLTTYLGPNSIRILIHDIPGGKLQRLQLEYLSLCDYFQGKVEYHYPLETADFTTYPVDEVAFSFQIVANEDILATSLAGFSSSVTTAKDSRHLGVTAEMSKMYLTSDVTFSYTVKHDSLSLDFYAVANDTMDGHFVMMVNPKSGTTGSDVLSKNVVFVIDCGSALFYSSLDVSKKAFADCIKRLNAVDSFSVVAFDYSVRPWVNNLVPATTTMTDSALSFISKLSYTGGSSLSSAIGTSLALFKTPEANNIVLLISDGKAVINPQQIRLQNFAKAAILPVSVVTSSGRQRLEMLAYQNYGFPTFFPEKGSISDEVLRFFDEVSYPVWRDVRYEIGSNAYGLLPLGLPTLFKGSRMYLTGRFKSPATSTLSLAGFTASGATFLDLPMTFPSSTTSNQFAEKFWAKEKIDDIERTIAVSGPADSLKQAVIKLSLGYGIRCMYTAYVADKTPSGGTGVEDQLMFTSLLAQRTSNGISIHWKFSAPSKVRRVDIYRRSIGETAFHLVGSVEGMSSSYLDAIPSIDRVSYRLETISVDGQPIRSEIFSPDGDLAPTYCALDQNFPNPFNPITEITYRISKESFVSLSVYNTLGQKIATLVNEKQDRGVYSVSFNAAGLPSGAYFYRVSAGSFVETKRMSLMK